MHLGYHNIFNLLKLDFLMLVHKLAQRILERMIRGFAIVKHTVKDIVIKALNTVKVGYFKSYLSPYPNH
jgi:hypothetical protein